MDARELARRLEQASLGKTFLGAAALLFGISSFVQGDFTIMGQPVPQSSPLRHAIAYVLAGLLVVSGAGLLKSGTVRPAAKTLMVIFGIYTLCYLKVLVGPPVQVYAFMGLAEQVSVLVGAWAVLLILRDNGAFGPRVARVVFGICSLLFALAHFVGRALMANAVPVWMPGGQMFWALATGVGHLAVGVALISNRAAVLATRVGALMYTCFVFLAWLPDAFSHPAEAYRWAGAAFSLCMAGALWLVGDLIFTRRLAAGTQRVQASRVTYPAAITG